MKFQMITIVLTLLNAVFSGEPVLLDSLGRAVSGNDVVTYHIDSSATPGDSLISYKWNEAIWLFSSEQNRESFKRNPEKYAPQYGGHCSFGMKYNGLYQADHEVFQLIEGKLYFNQDRRIEKWWLSGRERNIRKADQNWRKYAP